MKRFVEGSDRGQSTLFPECVADWIGEDNPVRVIEVFAEELDLAELGFSGVDPEVTGRPSYHPAVLLKLYIYGYLNRVQSSRRLEREAGRNVEVMWLTGRLAPDHKTIADFRKDMGAPSAKSAPGSFCFIAPWACSRKPAWRSMAAASSRRSTIGTETLPGRKWSRAWRRSMSSTPYNNKPPSTD